jgi:hypothetical protein
MRDPNSVLGNREEIGEQPSVHSHSLENMQHTSPVPYACNAIEALRGPNAERWRVAINAEISSIKAYEVRDSGGCLLPPGKQALPSHFVLNVKRDGAYKAQLVAGGHKQQLGIDYCETYAPTCSYRTLRMMLAVAARGNLELRQFDIRTAFLNGHLEEEV